MNLFANISEFMTGQQLKYDMIAVVDTTIIINGSDLDCGTKGSKAKKKGTYELLVLVL